MPNLLKRVQSADSTVSVTGKSFLQKSLPLVMKTLKYQGYVVSKDPKVPSFAEKVENSG